MGDPMRELEAARAAGDWLTAARICNDQLGDRDQAIACWIKALEGGGSDPAMFDGLERAFTETKNWTQLTTLLEHRLPFAMQDQKVEILRRLLAVYRDQLADEDKAQAVARRLVELTV